MHYCFNGGGAQHVQLLADSKPHFFVALQKNSLTLCLQYLKYNRHREAKFCAKHICGVIIND